MGVDLGGGKTCMLSGISGQLDRKLMALLAPLQWRQASLLEVEFWIHPCCKQTCKSAQQRAS